MQKKIPSVQINKYQIASLSIPMRIGFRHASFDHRQSCPVLVQLAVDNVVTGWGEAQPRQYLSGETVSSVVEYLDKTLIPQLMQIKFSPYENPLLTMSELRQYAFASPAAFCALELAVLDLLGKIWNCPAGIWLGENSSKIHYLTAPLGAAKGRKLLRLTRLFKILGFRDFKVKVGLHDIDTDIERLQLVRKCLGQNRTLRVDANASWSLQETREFAAKVIESQLQLSVIEQPLTMQASQDADWGLLEKELGIALMVDESLVNIKQADKLLSQTNSGCSAWNIRVAKMGLSQSLEIAMLGLAKKRLLHLGCLVGETSLLQRAGRILLAVKLPWTWVEYGFPRILLKNDPFRGCPGGYFGVATPLKSSYNGLGVRHI